MRIDRNAMLKNAYHFVVWAKRQRARELTAGKKAKASKSSATQSPQARSPSPSGVSTFSEQWSVDDADFDPTAGTALVRWSGGLPDELEDQGEDRITIEQFCGYSVIGFWQEVDRRFRLAEHMQRRVQLYVKNNRDMSVRAAQAEASQTGKKVVFILDTEDATIAEEGQPVPDTDLPDGEGFEADDRDALYREMVDKAIGQNANRLDMDVRLWRYNTMLAVGQKDSSVTLRDVALDLGHNSGETAEEVQAIQVSVATSYALDKC